MVHSHVLSDRDIILFISFSCPFKGILKLILYMAQINDSQVIRNLFIGIDFGTTYSAVAFSLHEWNTSRKPSTTELNEANIQSIQFDIGESQVKTQIAWHVASQDFVWGDDVDLCIRHEEISENDRIVLLKLGLEKSQATQEIRAKQKAQLSRIPPGCWGKGRDRRPPVIEDLISIFLGRLYDYAKTKIIKICGAVTGGNIFDLTDVRCAIGVPAIWTAEMDQTMVTAAEMAGLPNPDLVSESEAAAALHLREQEQQETSSIRRALGPSGSIMPHVSRNV